MAQAMSQLRWEERVMTAATPIVLEPAPQHVADAFSIPPFLYDMAPADARKVLEDAQSGQVGRLPVGEERITVPAQVADVRSRTRRKPATRPRSSRATPPCSGSPATGYPKGLDASP